MKEPFMVWELSFTQSIGGRSEQQDRVDIIPLQGEDAHLLVLADGMGGHRGGAEAAEQVTAVARRFSDAEPWGEPWRFLNDLCLAAHTQISTLDSTEARSPGSTCTYLLMRGAESYWAHVGDSRIYHLRAQQVLFRSRDHSVAELQAAQGSHRPVDVGRSRSQLYMRLGGNRDPEPALGGLVAEDGDTFLLCSDGFWSAMTESELTELCIPEAPVSPGSTQALVELARERGGAAADNISLIVARWSAPAVRRRSRLFQWRD
jgi:serine/threonine protein phosphatase PrpC